MAKVEFFRGTKAEYDQKVAQGEISADAIYYITDKGSLYVGETGTACRDTGWIPLAIATGDSRVQPVPTTGALNQQVPVSSGFAYRVVNGNHVYVAGGFKLQGYQMSGGAWPQLNLSAALPSALTPMQPIVTNGSITGWQVCNRRWKCPTNAHGIDAVVQLENSSRMLQIIGLTQSGTATLEMVSVTLDYFINS